MRKAYEYLFCSCLGKRRKKQYPAHNDPAGFLAAAVASKKSVRRISSGYLFSYSRIDSDESLADDSTASSKSDRLEVAPPGSTLTRLPKFSLRTLKKKSHKKKSSSCDQLMDDDSDVKDVSASYERKKGFRVRKILSSSYASCHDGGHIDSDTPNKKFKNLVLDTMRFQKTQKGSTHELSITPPGFASESVDIRSSDVNPTFHRGFTDPIDALFCGSYTNTDDSNLHEDRLSIMTSSTMSLHTEDGRGEGDGASLADIGSTESPMRECFGTVTFSVHSVSSKALGVHIYSIQGLPCTKGRESGLCLEVTAVQGGKSVWIPIAKAKASKIIIDNEVTVKLASHRRKDHSNLTLRITVWTAGRTWKHSAIGNVIYPCSRLAKQEVCQLGLYQHIQMYRDLGVIELSISCVSEPGVNGSQSSKVNLNVEIIRAKLTMDDDHKKHSALKHIVKDRRDIWCRISVWSKGQRTQKDVTSRTRIPVTNDPVFRSSSSFSIERSSLPSISLVVKLMVDRGIVDGTYGRLILGPHLYLGDPRDCVAPGTLSHWGRALTHPGPVKAWHTLYL